MKVLTMIAVAALTAMAYGEQAADGGDHAEGRHARHHAAERMRNRPMPMGMAQDPLFRTAMSPQMAEKLGLSEEQKAKLGDASELREKSRQLQEKVRAGTRKQMELLQADKIDEAAVMAAIDEVFEIRKELAKEQTRRVIAIRSVLTPEQVAKLREEVSRRVMRPAAKDKGASFSEGKAKQRKAKKAPKAE